MKILSIITLIIGLILLGTGIAKLSGNFDVFTMTYGNAFFRIETWNSLFYSVVINVCGGAIYIWFALSTFFFGKQKKVVPTEDLIDNDEVIILPKELTNRMLMFSYGVILVSIWHFISLYLFFSAIGFEWQFAGLIYILWGFWIPFTMVPLIYASLIINRNNKIHKAIQKVKLEALEKRLRQQPRPK